MLSGESSGAHLCKKGELPQKTDWMSRYSSVRAAESDAQIGSALSARYASTCRRDDTVKNRLRHHIVVLDLSLMYSCLLCIDPKAHGAHAGPSHYVHQQTTHASDMNREVHANTKSM